MQLPDLTSDQQKLIGQYWNYDDSMSVTLSDYILNQINMYLNNIMIEQTNRNALVAVEPPSLLDVQEVATFIPDATPTTPDVTPDSEPNPAPDVTTVTNEEPTNGLTENN